MNRQNKKNKKLSHRSIINKSVTSLLSSSNEEENSDNSDFTHELPKSIVSIKSLAFKANSQLKETKTKLKKNESIKKKDKLKTRLLKKDDNLELTIKIEDKSINKENLNREIDKHKLLTDKRIDIDKQINQIDLQDQEMNRKQPDKCINDDRKLIKPKLIPKIINPLLILQHQQSRTNDPPPTIEEDNGLLDLTPSEINLYLDNEKDLVETAICKKQHTQLLDNLKVVTLCPKISSQLKISQPKDSTDQSSQDCSYNELENLFSSTEFDQDNKLQDLQDNKLGLEKLDLKDDKTNELTYDEIKTDADKEQLTISKEITARYEHLILDPLIFEKAINCAQDSNTVIPQIEQPQQDADSVNQETNQLTATQQVITIKPTIPTIPTTTPIESNIVLPKEQFDNPIVIYKLKNKKEKKKKRKKKRVLRIGIIGAGRMSETIVNLLIRIKINPENLYISSPSGRNLSTFEKKGCKTTKRNIDIFNNFCHVIFLAFNGGVVKYCYKLGGKLPFPLTTTYVPVSNHRYHIFSLVTGINLNEIKSIIFNPNELDKYQFEIHRIVLYNDFCSFGNTSICGIDCELNKLNPVVKIFLEKIGELEYIPEKEMDAACTIIQCGSAFSYYFLNSISDAACKIGLSKEKSIRLAAHIAYSSVECLNRIKSKEFYQFFEKHPVALVGLEYLKKHNILDGIESAVKAAYDRNKELAARETAPAF